MKKYFSTLSFHNGSQAESLTLGILHHGGLAELGPEFLSADELNIYNSFKVDRRRSEFLAGRYIAKESIRQENTQLSPNAINIVPGVWGFPLIHSPGLHKATVSIGHTDRCVTAIFYSSNTHPVGIDIEEIKSRNLPAFKTFISDVEQELITSRQLPFLDAMHLIWSAKEAAGKALRVGFTIPETLYTISSVDCDQGLYHICFEKLSILQVIGWLHDEFSICIAFPSVWKFGELKRRTTVCEKE